MAPEGLITTAPPTAKAQPATLEQSVEEGGFTFSHSQCERSGKNVICSILITSNDQDRELRIWIHGHYGFPEHGTKIIDNLGNGYSATKGQLGDKYSQAPLHQNMHNSLVAGIPTKASFSFEGVVSEARSIALFEIGCDTFKAQLRNIPLSE